jgi:hypothetical protein
MNMWKRLLLSIVAAASFAADARAEEVPTLKCEVGPVTRQYGGADWLVYSCDDKRSRIVVTAPGNPAGPYYFFYLYSDKGYDLRGEGTGDKQATDKAYEDLKNLSEDQIASLLLETQKASIHK